MLVLTMSLQNIYHSRCESCGRAKSALYDPHLRCWRCKSACAEDNRCEECEHLSTEEFKRFCAALKKGQRQAANRQYKRSSAHGQAETEDQQDDDSFVVRETGSDFDDELPGDLDPPTDSGLTDRAPPREFSPQRPKAKGKSKKRKRSRSRSQSRSRSHQIGRAHV